MADKKSKNGISVEHFSQYDPERDAPGEHELNKHFLELIPASTFHNFNRFILNHLYVKLGPEEGLAFDRLLSEYPMLFRDLVYIYNEPDEDYETRMKMLRFWHEADKVRNDLKNPQIQQDVFLCQNLSNHPDIVDCSILKEFLNGLGEDFSLVLHNDLRKLRGHEASIQELRDNWKIVHETENEKIVTIDNSPFDKVEYRIEKITQKAQFHQYVLDDSNTDDFFLHADSFMTEWLQRLPDWKEIHSIDVFIYGPDEKLVKAPGKHTNPFPFNLLKKYEGLIQSAARKHGQMISRSDIEASTPDENIFKDKDHISQSDSIIAFLEKVLPEWKGDLPPSAHFSEYLPKRLLDKLRDRKQPENIRMKKSQTIDDTSFYDEENDEIRQMVIPGAGKNKKRYCDDFLSGEDLSKSVEPEEIPDIDVIPFDKGLEEQEQHDILKQVVLEEEKVAQNPLKRLILQHISETFEGVPEMTARQLSDRLYQEANKQVTEQAVTKARRKIEERLILRVKESLDL
ncbi:MAG: hypothetical protein K9K64_08005 [Desulfohalobiaceae bacterium]|nr:hypothetical protein [Desulfohalobiaceae bacterium]